MHLPDGWEQSYHDNGFVHLPQILPTVTLHRVQQRLERWVDAVALGVARAAPAANLHTAEPFERRLALLAAELEAAGPLDDHNPLDGLLRQQNYNSTQPAHPCAGETVQINGLHEWSQVE